MNFWEAIGLVLQFGYRVLSSNIYAIVGVHATIGFEGNTVTTHNTVWKNESLEKLGIF